MTTLLPAVLEENHHLPILGIILLQHTLLQHIPVSKEIMQCVEASLAVAEDTISTSNFNVQSTPVLQFHYIIANLFGYNYKHTLHFA